MLGKATLCLFHTWGTELQEQQQHFSASSSYVRSTAQCRKTQQLAESNFKHVFLIWEDLGSPLSKQKTGQVNRFITNACTIFSSWDFRCLRFVPLYTLRVNAFQRSNGTPSQFMCTLLPAAEFNIYWGLGQVLIQLQNAITPEHQAAKAITALFGRPIHGMPPKSQKSQNNIATLRSEELRNPRSQPILEQLGPLRLLRPGLAKMPEAALFQCIPGHLPRAWPGCWQNCVLNTKRRSFRSNTSKLEQSVPSLCLGKALRGSGTLQRRHFCWAGSEPCWMSIHISFPGHPWTI